MPLTRNQTLAARGRLSLPLSPRTHPPPPLSPPLPDPDRRRPPPRRRPLLPHPATASLSHSSPPHPSSPLSRSHPQTPPLPQPKLSPSHLDALSHPPSTTRDSGSGLATQITRTSPSSRSHHAPLHPVPFLPAAEPWF
ncbi:hypothetical protein VPH35_053026 [Triticum aestivum]